MSLIPYTVNKFMSVLQFFSRWCNFASSFLSLSFLHLRLRPTVRSCLRLCHRKVCLQLYLCLWQYVCPSFRLYLSRAWVTTFPFCNLRCNFLTFTGTSSFNSKIKYFWSDIKSFRSNFSCFNQFYIISIENLWVCFKHQNAKSDNTGLHF